jgi:hypothetical protein
VDDCWVGEAVVFRITTPSTIIQRIKRNYRPKGRRSQGTPLKRVLEVRDRNGSTSDPTRCQLDDEDDDDDECGQ